MIYIGWSNPKKIFGFKSWIFHRWHGSRELSNCKFIRVLGFQFREWCPYVDGT